jgi:hypothetical protein
MDPAAGAAGAGMAAAGAAAGCTANGSMRATAALGPAGAPMPTIAFAAIDGSELAACWAAPVEIGALLEDEFGCSAAEPTSGSFATAPEPPLPPRTPVEATAAPVPPVLVSKLVSELASGAPTVSGAQANTLAARPAASVWMAETRIMFLLR